eukprot:3158423-Rhodomonas_salina.2
MDWKKLHGTIKGGLDHKRRTGGKQTEKTTDRENRGRYQVDVLGEMKQRTHTQNHPASHPTSK